MFLNVSGTWEQKHTQILLYALSNFFPCQPPSEIEPARVRIHVLCFLKQIRQNKVAFFISYAKNRHCLIPSEIHRVTERLNDLLRYS